jgi:hypothetical protein
VKKLLEAARRREIDVVLVWRWIAGAGQSLIYGATLQELHHLGVGFMSLTEEILRERTLAGLAQAEWKRARCVAANAISPLRKGETTEVLHMASEDACEHDMLVQIRWQGRKMAVPLSQLAAINADESTQEAIGDWHYWVAQSCIL